MGAVARPAVSVVVPFLGSDADLAALIATLKSLARRDGDELIVADNRTTDPAPEHDSPVVVHPAGGVHSPGFARNRGAAIANRDWIVFFDADTSPAATLLDDYFAAPPAAETGVMAGGIVDVAPPGAGLAARHAVHRRHLSQPTTLDRPAFRYAQTANCAVRRAAFVSLGGFDEGIRAAEDADLCFRLRTAGWRLEARPTATVEHRARATTARSLAQLARHGAGAAWCNRRHPGSFPPPTPRQFAGRLLRSGAVAIAAVGRRDPEAAAFAALEIAEACAFEGGRLLPNRARR